MNDVIRWAEETQKRAQKRRLLDGPGGRPVLKGILLGLAASCLVMAWAAQEPGTLARGEGASAPEHVSAPVAKAKRSTDEASTEALTVGGAER
jgi:hypothetical protein